MKNLKQFFAVALTTILFTACSSDDDLPVSNSVTLQFDNTFGDESIVLGDATSTSATVNTSSEGQVHHFSELKYVISNIRLVKEDDTEIFYNVNDLDEGAIVVNQAKPETSIYELTNIPSAEYKQIKFGLGVRSDINRLDETRFPDFYAAAGANDTQMHWEWGTGYRFTKIEGFYSESNDTLSIHTGSTVEGEEGSYTQGVDAYRDITLDLPTSANVGGSAPRITIKADFDKLLSGAAHTITLGEGNATPSIHTAANMVFYVDNLGGNGNTDTEGMFSIENVTN